MLNKVQSFKAYHGQAVRASLNLLRCQPIATLMTSMVIAMALALPMLFWVFANNMSHFTADWNERGMISAYLKPALADEAVQKTLQQVGATPGVAHTSLISAAQGLVELTAQEGMHDVMHSLAENPLPALIEIIPQVNINVAELVDRLRLMVQIDEVKMDSEWLSRLRVLLAFAAQLTHILLVFLALAVLFIISNTLRLMIQNRYEEIQVLKLIGATDSFVARPFLYLGVYYGLSGALVAVLLINLFVFSLSRALNQLIMMYQIHYSAINLSLRQILILFSFSIILGWLSAYVCIKRQMSGIEPAM